MSAFVKVLIILQFIILLLPNIASSSVPTFSIKNEKIDKNSSNTTSGCHAKISESAVKFILELMNDKITHVIDLNIWSDSVNNTMSKTRVPTGVKWANEIGRTLISLIAQAEKSDNMMLLSYTYTMKAGIYSMNIAVAKDAMRCFISSDNTSNHAIFDLLVQQLYHISGSKTGYKLCLPHNDKRQVANYNCCTIVGPNDSLICSDYSSIVTKMSHILGLIAIAFILYIAFPVTQEYLSQFPERDTYYRISISPMSLSFILYLAFIEGHGPVKSWVRKCMFVLFVVVTTLPEYGSIGFFCYIAFVGPWSFYFLVIMKFNFNEKSWNACLNPIKSITLPFNITKVWKYVSNFSPCIAAHITTHELPPTEPEAGSENLPETESVLKLISINGDENAEDTSELLLQHEEEKIENVKKLSFIGKVKKRFFVLAFFIFYLICIPILSLVAFILLIRDNWRFVRKQVRSEGDLLKKEKVRCIVLMIFITITYGVIGFSVQNLFRLVLYFIFGLFLNGEIYSPYLLPLSTIIFFSWTKWRSSVETKYLVLITNIFKVCKESYVESDEWSNNRNENSGKSFKIKLDHYGDPQIQKELYDYIRKKLLPYNRILFHYFQGVFLVAVFAYILYILLSLAQTSEISGSVQVIGTIAATSLPFIFDFIWKKKSDEQKEADSIVLKSKLKRVLRDIKLKFVKAYKDEDKEKDYEDSCSAQQFFD